jgi:hypothetical protein
MGKIIKPTTKPKVEKSRRKNEVRTSMFVTKSVYESCTKVSERVGLPMRQIWEAGVMSIFPLTTDEIKEILTTSGITPGWRARK